MGVLSGLEGVDCGVRIRGKWGFVRLPSTQDQKVAGAAPAAFGFGLKAFAQPPDFPMRIPHHTARYRHRCIHMGDSPKGNATELKGEAGDLPLQKQHLEKKGGGNPTHRGYVAPPPPRLSLRRDEHS